MASNKITVDSTVGTSGTVSAMSKRAKKNTAPTSGRITATLKIDDYRDVVAMAEKEHRTPAAMAAILIKWAVAQAKKGQ